VRTRIALTLIVALLAAACGDDAEPAPGQAPGTTAPAGQAPTVPGTVTPGGLPSSQCIELSMALSQAATMGMMGSGDIEDAAGALRAMASAAPREFSADFMILASALEEFFRAVADAGVDFADPSTYTSPQAQQALADASDAFEASGADEASDRIGDYLESVCG
jgi:hypothetical protein